MYIHGGVCVHIWRGGGTERTQVCSAGPPPHLILHSTGSIEHPVAVELAHLERSLIPVSTGKGHHAIALHNEPDTRHQTAYHYLYSCSCARTPERILRRTGQCTLTRQRKTKLRPLLSFHSRSTRPRTHGPPRRRSCDDPPWRTPTILD